MIELTSSHVRELKGAPISLLVLLAISPMPVNKDWLIRHSGYTDKPVLSALQYLREEGYIDRSRSGWFLAHGFQLPLSDEIRNNSVPINIINDSNQEQELKEINNNNRKNSASLLSVRNNSVQDEIWKLLHEAGINRNERTEAMLELPHVTVEYLQRKVAEYKARGTSGAKWAGLLIRAIEEAEPGPAAPVELRGQAVLDRVLAAGFHVMEDDDD